MALREILDLNEFVCLKFVFPKTLAQSLLLNGNFESNAFSVLKKLCANALGSENERPNFWVQPNFILQVDVQKI